MIQRDLIAAALTMTALLAAAPNLDRVFDAPSWRLPVLAAAGAATLLVLTGSLTRLSRLTTALAGLAVLLVAGPWLAGAVDSPSLPTPAVLRGLIDTTVSGFEVISEVSAPAPVGPGLLLLAVTGWWLAAHLAAEWVIRDRRGGRGLAVITVLWGVPLLFPTDVEPAGLGDAAVGTVVFLAAGLLMLLGTQVAGPSLGRLGAGLAVGGAVIAVAVSGPGLLPGEDAAAWFSPGGTGGARGYQPIVDVTDRLSDPAPRDLLRVTANQPTYLRLAGLDHFNGDVWRLGAAEAGSYQPQPSSLTTADELLPAEQPASRTEVVEVAVTVLDLENIYVPVPYQPVEVLGPVRDELVWSTEGGFLTSFDAVAGRTGTRASIRSGTEYRVRAARPTPSAEELRAVSIDADVVAERIRLPRDYPRLAAQAESVFEEAGATDTLGKILALQDWFASSGEFTYDLDVPPLRSGEGLADFVLGHRTGYCEYFASAMAVMLREAGVPARVAVGFLPGRQVQEPDGQGFADYVVATTDAHAWVEVLFPGYGWVTFEPTPRSDEGQIVPRIEELAPRRTEAERQRAAAGADAGGPSDQPPEPLEPAIEPPTPQADEAPDPTTGTADTDGDRGAASGTLAAFLVLVGAVVALAAVLRTRRSDSGTSPRERVLAAQRRLLDDARVLGVPRARHETISEVLARWDREGRTTSASSLSTALQTAAFGGDVAEEDASRAESGVAVARAELRGTADSRPRRTAWLRRIWVALGRQG